MAEINPSPVLPPKHSQSNPRLIALAVFVLTLCFCVGLAGLIFAFGSSFLN